MKNIAVLDLGCGEGYDALYLAKKGAIVDCVDRQNVLKVNHENINIIIDNISDFTPQKKYQVILCFNVLQFFKLKDIKIEFKRILAMMDENSLLFLQMFNSPIVDWINKQLDEYMVMDYRQWEQEDKEPHPHTHNMVRWIIKKEGDSK